ncbi:SOS response-associated peptidase family protein [Adlercreutzia sp. R21]|uniref:SOS response-associated peptidase family protein n=1 Tax=Adlercreutzia wanghongyangiae TaxID=3111451 RepID=UPI002DB8DB3A|nr:SOS response-associated peptidase family protein [Adlercreutzia sp. R21]MEC4184426.1 SOS response-associated peptidase family protein [Adlercreutzia sp. R21]
MCHRFEMLNAEEADAVLDWLRAVRRALAVGPNAAAVAPPAFGHPAEVPFDALDCYPGAESSVIVAEEDNLARVDLVWGVDVPWKRGLVFNARIESALTRSDMWAEAMERGRCIVPVRAFYETQNVEVPEPGGVRGESAGQDYDTEQGVLGVESAREAAARPAPRARGRRPQYRFANAGGAALLLAALRLGDRFVLVTTEPDAVVGTVHNRMPLSLTAPEALAWLSAADARKLLVRHVPVPLTVEEEPAPAKRPADPDQLSLF